METYFNESVQGLDIGSKMKYRGVVIGEVTRISFTYVKYQHDKPMAQRKRYVLVEAQLQPRLVGGRASTATSTSPENDRRGGRAGPARAPRAAGHHRHQLPRDRLRRSARTPVLPIDWVPDNIYIPSAPSTVTQFVNAAQRDHRAAAQARHRRHGREPQQPAGHATNDRIGGDRHAAAAGEHRAHARQDRDDARPAAGEEAVRRGDGRCIAELRADQRRAQVDARQPGVAAAAAGRERRDRSSVQNAGGRSEARRSRSRISSARSAASTGCSAAARPTSATHAREPAPDHRQPARPHRGREALSGQRALRRAAPPAGAHAMIDILTRRAARAAGARLLAALLCAALAGCALTRPAPVKETYLLEPAMPPAARDARSRCRVRVATVNVAAPFRGRQFVYRDDALRYETDYYSEFLVAPAAMLTEQTVRALAAAACVRARRAAGLGCRRRRRARRLRHRVARRCQAGRHAVVRGARDHVLRHVASPQAHRRPAGRRNIVAQRGAHASRRPRRFAAALNAAFGDILRGAHARPRRPRGLRSKR